MPLQSSGPLKFTDIEREFGQSIVRSLGEYRISKNIGDMSNIPLDEGIGQVGDDGTASSIRFSQFKGKRLNVIVHYANDETRAIGGHNKYNPDNDNDDSVTVIGPEGGVKDKPNNGRGAKVTLHVSGTLLSNKENKERSALRSGSPEYWDESVILHMNIGHEAVVSGSGGDGGAGGNPDSNNGRGENGEDGSSAIGIATPVEKIIVQSGGVVQAGGGGGGGGAGVKNNDAKLSGPSGGGGSGLPAGGAAAPPPAAAAGAVLSFQVRSSSIFVNQETGALSPIGTGGSFEGSGGYFSGGVGYRAGSLGWTSVSDSPINETVTMTGSNTGTNFRVSITYSPWQRPEDVGTSNYRTKITINSVTNSGEDYAVGNILSTSTWNNYPGNSSRIIKVTNVSSSSGGNSGGVASDLGKEAGDGGNGSAIDTGDGGGVASGGGGGGGSPYGGGFLGQGGTRGIKPEDNAEDGKDGSTGKGGDGGFSDAEGSEQIDREDGAVGGTGGDNGYAIITKNVPLPTVIGTVIGQKYRGGSNIQI